MSEIEQYLGRYPEDYFVDLAGPSRFRVENKNTGNVEFAPTIARAVYLDHQWERDLAESHERRWEALSGNRGFALDY